MKINGISLLNYNVPQFRGGGNSPQNNENKQFDYAFAEMLGRSQVNFTGQKNKNNKYQEYDKMFIDTVAQNLRLSDEDKQRLTADIQSFLNANNFKSLEDIAGDKNSEIQADFISELGDDICQSDFDYEILGDAFQDRMYYDGRYEPQVDLYEKDYEVVESVLDKYGLSEAEKADIFDVLKENAEFLKGKTLFDLFKPENKPEVLMDVIRDQLQFDKNLAVDLLIDFSLIAKKDEEARREGIYPWKYTMLENEQAKDNAIACEIVGQYDLVSEDFLYGGTEDIDDDDDDTPDPDAERFSDIMMHLNKRRAGVNAEQIAYELMDKYNLPSDAYDFIKNTIYEYDALEDDED